MSIHCQRRICLKYYNSLNYLVQYPTLIGEKKRKRSTRKNQAKNPLQAERLDRIPESVYHENYLVFAKFSNQVAVQGCMIFVGNIAVMDFASLTRQVRIYKGIDAFLSMLIGLLRTFWMILNEPRIYLIRDEFREFTLLPLRSSPALSLLSHPFMSGVCSQLVRENCTNLSGTFKRIISLQFLAKKEFQFRLDEFIFFK